MILLDTDHATFLKYSEGQRGERLVERLKTRPPGEELAVSIVTVEEQMRGWLAAVAKERQARRQVFAYRELGRLFDYFRSFTIVPFDEQAANQFETLRASKIRLGVAAIALVNQALLLSRNLRDF